MDRTEALIALTTTSPQAREADFLTRQWSQDPSISLWLSGLARRSLEWADIERILASADAGALDMQGELYTKMVTSDAFIASVYRTYTSTIGGARRQVTARVPDNDIAAQQAEWCGRLLDELPHADRFVAQLADADWSGYSVAELLWERRGRELRPVRAEWIDRARLRMTQGFEIYLWDRGTAAGRARDMGLHFTAVDESGAKSVGVIPDEAARMGIALVENKYVVHLPRILPTYPNAAGLFRACVRDWFVKHWATLYQLDGAEIAGNPRMLLVYPDDDAASAPTRKQGLSDLAALAADGIGVTSGGTRLEIIAPTLSNSSVWTELIDRANDNIAQVALGSTLNVTVGETGGNRALGESQHATTIAPRMRASSSLIAATIEEQIFGPALRLNRHLWGGAVYIPRLEIVLSEAEPVLAVDQIEKVQAVLAAVTARTLAPEAADALLTATFPGLAPEMRETMVRASAQQQPAMQAGAPGAPLATSAPADGAPVADTSPNGAQQQQFINMLAAVTAGTLAPEAAAIAIQSFFSTFFTPDQVQRMVSAQAGTHPVPGAPPATSAAPPPPAVALEAPAGGAAPPLPDAGRRAGIN